MNEQTPHGLSPLHKVDEAAEILNVSTKSVRRWIDTKELEAYRIGRNIRISDDSLREFLNKRKV